MPQEQIIKIDYKHKSAKAGVWVYGFKSGDHFIAFIPSLNLTGYGPSEEEAIKMLFEHVMPDLFDNLLNLPEHEVSLELSKYGWKRSRFHKKQFKTKSFIGIDGILKNFDLPIETKISREFVAA